MIGAHIAVTLGLAVGRDGSRVCSIVGFRSSGLQITDG